MESFTDIDFEQLGPLLQELIDDGSWRQVPGDGPSGRAEAEEGCPRGGRLGRRDAGNSSSLIRPQGRGSPKPLRLHAEGFLGSRAIARIRTLAWTRPMRLIG